MFEEVYYVTMSSTMLAIEYKWIGSDRGLVVIVLDRYTYRLGFDSPSKKSVIREMPIYVTDDVLPLLVFFVIFFFFFVPLCQLRCGGIFNKWL